MSAGGRRAALAPGRAGSRVPVSRSGAGGGDQGLRGARERAAHGGGSGQRLQRHGQDAAVPPARGHPDPAGRDQSLRLQQRRRRWVVPPRAGSSGPADGVAAAGCLLPTDSLAGVLKFARLIKSYESQDPEIASMSGKLKAMFLPPMTLPPHGAGTGGVATS